MGTNDITGDRLVSKIPTDEYRDNWEIIFKKPASCLDSAYEREAMKKGLVKEPVFDENKLSLEEMEGRN